MSLVSLAIPVDMSSSPCYVLSKAQPDGIKFCSRRPRSITQCANFRDLFQLSSTRCKKEKKKAGVWMGGTSVSRRLTTISLPYRNHITATWNEQRNKLSQSGLVQRRSYRWLCQDSTTMSLHMCFVGHESTLQLYAPPPGAH